MGGLLTCGQPHTSSQDAKAGDQVCLIEVHPKWSGPVEVIRPYLWSLKVCLWYVITMLHSLTSLCLCEQQRGDKLHKPIDFYTVAAEQVSSLQQYRGRVRPLFLICKNGVDVAVINGVDVPQIRKILRNEANWPDEE